MTNAPAVSAVCVRYNYVFPIWHMICNLSCTCSTLRETATCMSEIHSPPLHVCTCVGV